jgi:sugar phosphate isomerase/epimerase
VRRILWAATVGGAGLAERLEVAAATGYEAVSVSPMDHAAAVAAGDDPADLRRRAADLGVALAVLDAVAEWYPHEPPRRRVAASEFTVDDVLRIADDYEVESVNAIAPYPTRASPDALAAAFGALCDRAAGSGRRVHIEFIPWPPVGDVTVGADLVAAAGRPNGGVLVDTWHLFRSQPAAEALAALEAVPAERVHAVQVSDGGALVESLGRDTFRHRRLPGEGGFPLGELFAVLRRTGALHAAQLVGPEVLSDALAARPAAEAAAAAAAALDRVLAAR